jgi:hypothetical protein
MSVLQDLVLALQTRGFREGAAEVEQTAGAIRKTDVAAKDASVSTVGLGKAFGGLKDMAKSAAGMAGVAGLAFGVTDAISSVVKFQEAQSQLGASIKANVVDPSRDATDEMSKFAESLATRGGFDAPQAIQGMTQFLRVTHDIAQSESDLTLATNIARGAHVDLGRAVRAVTLLEQGRTTGLSKLGITVAPVTTALDALKASHQAATAEQIKAAKATDALATKQQAMAQVSREYGGAMRTYSHTTAGTLSNLYNSFEQLAVSVGQAVLPAVTVLAKAIGALVKPLESVLGVVKELMPVILATVGAWTAYKLVTGLVSVVTTILNADLWGNVAAFLALIPEVGSASEAMALFGIAMDSIPIVGWIAGIGAMVGALFMLYKHVKWFRDAVNATWKWLKTATTDAFHWVVQAIDTAIKWIEHHWPLVIGILGGPIAFAVAEIVKHFDTIKRLPGEILHLFEHAASDIAKAIVSPFKSAFDWVKHHLPHISMHHIGPISVPLPSFQAGGPVPSSGPVLVGERGPEIVNLPGGSYVHPNAALGSDRPIVIYNILDGKVLSQAIVRQGLLQVARGG